MSNNKMYYLSNMDSLDEKDVIFHTYEYELIVDSNLVGEFSYGPYEIVRWESGLFNEGDCRKLILKTKESMPCYDEAYFDNLSSKKYYHGGGIADEITALASLFLRRRIKLIQSVRCNDKPDIFVKKPNNYIDKQLILGSSDITDLSTWFDLLERMDEVHHPKFMLATRLYHRSVLMIEDDPDLAYLTLISAIETLCVDYPLEKIPTLKSINSKLDGMINSLIEDDDSKTELKKLILKNNRFIKKRFVAFIMNYISDDFWNYENQPNVGGKIKTNDLEKHLCTIYDKRSKILHEGEPIIKAIFHPQRDEEIMTGMAQTYRGKQWKPNDYIPHVHFFERLVNTVLKNYVQEITS